MRRWLALSPADADQVAEEVYMRLTCYSDDALAESPQDQLLRIAASVIDERPSRGTGFVNGTGSHVRAAVAELPLQQREALLLHTNEHLTYKQVAARLRLAPHVARRSIVSAYTYLRCELRPPNRM